MTHLSWVALHGMAHSFIELDKAVVHVIRLVSFLWLWFSVCLPSDGEGLEAYGRFLMRENDWGGNWLLFWWAGPCLVNLQSNFLLIGRAVFPPYCLTWGQTMVEIMKIMVTSFKRSHAAFSVSDPVAGHCWPTPLPETPGHSWACLPLWQSQCFLFHISHDWYA